MKAPVLAAQREADRGALLRSDLTELGNAERLVAARGESIRWVPKIGWHTWTGTHWRPDDDGAVKRLMRDTLIDGYTAAAGMPDEERSKFVRHLARSETHAKIEAAVALAAIDERVIARVDELDADPFLFNVRNGVVNLKTGRLQRHSREALMTKIAEVKYAPDARSKVWDDFLRAATDGDNELAQFLKRAAGYSLTGDVSEEKLFFAHGPTATGKSSFLEALKAVWGSYGATADFESFLARRSETGPRHDIARLAGARLVTSIEVDEGKRLAEGLIKQITGGDALAVRFMYRDIFEYHPAFKLWLAANERPKVNAADAAIWRRILQVPFVHTIPEGKRDPNVKKRLRHDPDVQAAVLAWAVEGARDWLDQEGLAPPALVLAYTEEYRTEVDPFADFLTDFCEFLPNAWAATRDLYESYEEHTRKNGEKPASKKALGLALEAKGCVGGNAARRAGQRGWNGVTLKPGVFDG